MFRQTLNQIESRESVIQEIAGSIVIIELKLRLLAEEKSVFRSAINALLDPKKKDRNRYWNCDIAKLCTALEHMLSDKLTLGQRRAITNFKEQRDKMLHADLVALAPKLGLPSEGQQIYASGKRNTLEWDHDDPEKMAKKHVMREAIARFCNRSDIVARFREIFIELNKLIEDLLARD